MFMFHSPVKRYAPWFLVLVAVALSVYTHMGVFDQFIAPTYGNTGIHQASAREMVETGAYPLQNDFSYGGGMPNLYVPIYRFLLAQLVSLGGLDFDTAQRWAVMLFAVALALGFYFLGSSFGKWQGVAAAFLASVPPELLVYTIRPLPQGLGLVMLAFAFALVLRNNWSAVLAGILVALVHQEAAVFFAVAVFAYFVAAKAYDRFCRTDTPSAMMALYAWFATTATYFLWHFFVLGNFNVFDLAQFKHHEGAKVTVAMLQDKTGTVLFVLGAIGAFFVLIELWRLFKQKKPAALQVFAFSVLAVGLFAILNDLVGIGVFMDRFIVYLQFPLILLAAHGLVRAAFLFLPELDASGHSG